MAADVNRVHHVVWCVHPHSLSRVRELWERGLGLTLQEVDLPEDGVVVLVSWESGVEVMSPVHSAGDLGDSARMFLQERGEGVYSVVFNVADIDDAVSKLSALGGLLVFRDDISAAEFDERKISTQAEAPAEDLRQALFEDLCGMRICLQQEGSHS